MATSLPPWTQGASRTLASTRILELRGVMFSHPARAAEREFTVIHSNDWVNVVAVTTDREMVLVRQFRYGSGAMSLEIPGGIIEAGEDPMAAGLRELKEETGYASGTARWLGSIHPNPAIQDNRCHLVWVEGVSLQGARELDEDEDIEVITLPVDEVYALAHAGEITHALALNGLFLFAPHWAAMKAR